VSNQVEGSLSAAYCNVGESEADWDDESGKIEVRFELNATAQGQAGIGIQRVTFNVSALVTLP
jgi:hypothetical protein